MKRRRGYAIILVLAAAAVISAVLISVSSTTTPLRQEAFRLPKADAARALAEAGVLLTRKRLADDPSFAGVEQVPLGDGTVTVKVQRAGGRFRVTSRGTVDGVNARVRAAVRVDGAVLAWEDL